MNEVKKVAAAGILAIGDPHVSGRKPGTRNDENFIDTVVGKIEQAADMANARNLQAIFLGDLFDRDQETNPYLLVRLTRALKKFHRRPFELMGNHDINETAITDNTSIALMREAEVLNVIEDVGLFLILEQPNGTKIGVGASPYGLPIPADVSDLRTAYAVNQVVWITHHDLAFDGAYPGAQELHAVRGCDLVINGHMHLTKPAVKVEGTTWFNPGNITRQSKDTAQHVPSVWEVVDPQAPAVQHVLEYRQRVFDVLEGFVPAAKPGVGGLPVAATSEFVRQLREYAQQETDRTEDGSELARDLALVFESLRVPAVVADAVMTLHAATVTL